MRALDRDEALPHPSTPLERLRARTATTKPSQLLLAGAAIVAASTTLPWMNRPMFRDEAATIYSAHLSWSHLLQQSRHVDFVLLPYYALMHVWFMASGRVEWGRLLSAAAFGLTVYLTGRIATRIGGAVAGLIAVILCATNPSMFHSGIYLRPYALSALAATLGCLAIVSWYRDGEDRLLWLFAAATIAALLLQLFSALAPLSALFAAAILDPSRFKTALRTSFKPLALVATVFLVFVPIAASQRQQVAWIKLDFFTNKVYLGPAAGSSAYEHTIIVLFLGSAAVCLAAVLLTKARPSRVQMHSLLMVAAWAALPTAILVTASVLFQPVYVLRYVTASAPGLAVLIALMLGRAMELASQGSTWRVLVVSGAGLATSGLLFTSGTVTTGQTIHEDFRAAAKYVAANLRPGDVVALPDHSITTAVNYYLKRDKLQLPHWPQLARQEQIEGLDLALDPGTELATLPSGVWLVEDGSTHGLSAFQESLVYQGYVLYQVQTYKEAQVLEYRIW